jgi:hypothetical protein
MSSGLHARVPRASPCPWVAHPVSGRLDATIRPFGLAFAPAPPVPGLTSPRQITRWLILQKARRHPTKGLRPAGSRRFQDLFHSLHQGAFHRSLTVLVHYRSPAVFSLGPWSTLLPTRFFVPGGTHAQHALATSRRRLRGSHPLRPAVPGPFSCQASLERGVGCPLPRCRPTPQTQRQPARTRLWFGLLPFRSPLLRESSLFLEVLRCFSSPGSPRHPFGVRSSSITRRGLPHSDTSGSPVASTSPERFAAWLRPSSAAGAKASTVCPSSRIFPRVTPRLRPPRGPIWPT